MKPTNNRKMLADFARRLTPNAALNPPNPTTPGRHNTSLTVTRENRDYHIHLHTHDRQDHITTTITREGTTLAHINKTRDLDLLEHLIHQVITHHTHNPGTPEQWSK